MKHEGQDKVGLVLLETLIAVNDPKLLAEIKGVPYHLAAKMYGNEIPGPDENEKLGAAILSVFTKIGAALMKEQRNIEVGGIGGFSSTGFQLLNRKEGEPVHELQPKYPVLSYVVECARHSEWSQSGDLKRANINEDSGILSLLERCGGISSAHRMFDDDSFQAVLALPVWERLDNIREVSEEENEGLGELFLYRLANIASLLDVAEMVAKTEADTIVFDDHRGDYEVYVTADLVTEWLYLMRPFGELVRLI